MSSIKLLLSLKNNADSSYKTVNQFVTKIFLQHAISEAFLEELYMHLEVIFEQGVLKCHEQELVSLKKVLKSSCNSKSGLDFQVPITANS